MSRKHSKDLFDDTSMTFGEHLEELRIRLWRAIVGLVLVTSFTMYFGDQVMAIVRKPIEDALHARGAGTHIADEVSQMFNLQKLKDWWNGTKPIEPTPPPKPVGAPDPKTITIQVRPAELLTALHEADPQHFPAPPPTPIAAAADVSKSGDSSTIKPEKLVALQVTAPEFEQLKKAVEMQQRPIVLTVQEGFKIGRAHV